MKKILCILTTISILTFVVSCNTCDEECKNGGTCEGGECECPSNYDGETCEFRCVECTGCTDAMWNVRMCEDDLKNYGVSYSIDTWKSYAEAFDSTCVCH